MTPLKIAMIGQRGVPATYGGIERHVEEIGARLAERGHEVTVYCRRSYVDGNPPHHRGMRLVYRPAAVLKHLEAMTHSVVSSADSLARDFDVVHYHAVGPGLAAPLPRWLSRSSVVLTVHGLDAERGKWNGPAQGVLRVATWMSARVPDQTIVVSQALADHFQARYSTETVVIPNGVSPQPAAPSVEHVRALGLRPGRYVLFVGRLVPEKAPDLLIRAFQSVAPNDIDLVVVGGSSHTDEYAGTLRDLARGSNRIHFPGFVYGDELRELYAHAAVFVLPSDLEGLPLTLLEAAAAGVPVLASNIAPHVEIVGSSSPGARLFQRGDLSALARELRAVLASCGAERDAAMARRQHILARYSWDRATEETERVYHRVRESGRRPARSAAGPPVERP